MATTRQVSPIGVCEGCPAHWLDRLRRAERELQQITTHELFPGISPQYILANDQTRWRPGDTVRVAFLGGGHSLLRDIAEVAAEWTAHGNLHLDFGYNSATQQYRTWSTSDSDYQAEIRIAFEHPDAAYRYYWSWMGRDSINPALSQPYEPSMNLQDFHVQRPDDWAGVVLHEFGHALGFHHEHQNPEGGCEDRFLWDDDDGYVPTTDSDGSYIPDHHGNRPGVYRVLCGPPNHWTPRMVCVNFRSFPDSRAYLIGEFDRDSIMSYRLAEWMYVDEPERECCPQTKNVLSDGDKQGMAAAYPYDAQALDELLASRRTRLEALLGVKGLSGGRQQAVAQHLDQLG